MNDIIKRNTECLEILKDIHSHIKNKKTKKINQITASPAQLLNSPRKTNVGYKAMTPSANK